MVLKFPSIDTRYSIPFILVYKDTNKDFEF